MLKIVVVVVLTLCCINAEIPSYIKVCKRNTPDLAQCIIDSVNALRPKLKEGIPELDVPSIEPLPLERVEMRSGGQSVKIDANFTNIKVWGPSAFKLIELKPNLAKNRFAFKFILPHLYFKGDYDMDMNILLLKYRGQGQIIGNFTNYDAEVVMKGHLKNIGGSNHLEFERFDMRLNLGHSYFFLDNLFKDQPTLAKATLDVITDNSELFANEVRPAIENALADVFTDIANKITSRFTYEELFPRN